MGQNGATCSYFCVPQRIARVKSLKPDVIILSFGTNEAHVRRYNADQHLKTLSQLVNMLQAACPQTTIMLTTPQGAYYSYRVAHYRTVRKTDGPSPADISPTTAPSTRTHNWL